SRPWCCLFWRRFTPAGAPRVFNRHRCCAMTESSSENVLVARNLVKRYDEGSAQIEVLSDVSLHVARAEMVAVVGASGSGKSTLLHMLGLLDEPTSGSVIVDGVAAHKLSEAQRSR